MRFILAIGAFACLAGPISFAAEAKFPIQVLPAEGRRMVDADTGAQLEFLTTDPADDQSLYYEQRSWLADESVILFNSRRTHGGLMGYVTRTGELLRLAPPEGSYGGASGANRKNSFYALRGNRVVEIYLELDFSSTRPTRATARERVLATLDDEVMPPNTALSENSDGTLLALGSGGRGSANPGKDGRVLVVDVKSGKVKTVRKVAGNDFSGHVVFSRTNPRFLSYIEAGAWLSVVDVSSGKRIFLHRKVGGEFATHHCWWLNDTITFTGGFHPQPTEDADLKILDMHTGEVRIAGKGSWWPAATPAQLARENWWHACGSEKGRWLVADNWHGDIAVFHAKTTRTYLLTRGHRSYGSGLHPEVGWDRKGEKVIFLSYKFGNADVCVATIPQAWQEGWAEQASKPAER